MLSASETVRKQTDFDSHSLENVNIETCRVLLFLPLKIPSFGSKKNRLHSLYGTVRAVPNGLNVYITSFEKTTSDLVLLGTLGISTDDEVAKPSNQPVWIKLNPRCNSAAVVSVNIGNSSAPLRNVTLVLYDTALAESELLMSSIDWKKSQCLSELGSALKATLNKTHTKTEAQEPESLTNRSKVIMQLRQRALNLKEWKNSPPGIASNNISLMIILDLILGFIFLSILHSLGGTSQVLETFLSSIKVKCCYMPISNKIYRLFISYNFIIQVIADNLQVLIEWLMGAPVGLKLNRLLTTVLGKFFIYHLYLWKTYIGKYIHWIPNSNIYIITFSINADIIQPVVWALISTSSMLGWMGLSFQIALLSDLITLASLHCYCFYVYAARLYGVVLHGLRSTFRMFGGRKWNPLRSRVDYGHFTWDQLCVGMFIFSSLLLLSPTILVYYVVFLAVNLNFDV